MEWKVAPSYQHMTIESVDEAARKAIASETCWKCGGTGIYAWFGECFACNGAGKIRKRIKVYTPEEYEKYIQNQERTKERKAEKKATERKLAEEHSEENMKKALAAAGYDPENPLVWLVTGDNTYAIKDWLLNNGAKYTPALNWYAAQPLDTPVGYGMVSIPFNSCFDWDCYHQHFLIKEKAKENAEEARAKVATPSASEYIGEIKERLRDLEVKFINARDVESFYGMSTLYTFKAGENVLVWFCSGKGLPQNIEIGDTFLLTGTVKDHKERNGVKQTVLTRCVAK